MSNNRYKILLVEEEKNISTFVQTVLEANDYQTMVAATCKQGMVMFSSHMPDLVILDLGLPDMDGTEFIRHARKTSTVPILVLSARSSEADKVQALDLGANDYIVKPFGPAELVARVRAALRVRRYSSSNAVPGGSFTLRDLVIDYDRRLVTVAGQDVKLTQTEYNILSLLASHTGKVLTYAAIIREIWGTDVGDSVKRLQVNMANIRKKLGSRPGDNLYIINELGVGYRMGEETL